MYTDNITVNSHGVNTAIQYHLVDETTLTEQGFRKMNYSAPAGEQWDFLRNVAKNIVLWVRFPTDRECQDELNINVIDECFGQPYDYQHILARKPNFPFALEVKAQVEAYMKEFSRVGIISGWKPDIYI